MLSVAFLQPLLERCQGMLFNCKPISCDHLPASLALSFVVTVPEMYFCSSFLAEASVFFA